MSAPRIGQPVHYMARGSADGVFGPVCRAAIVTEVHILEPVPEHGVPYVSLAVLNPTGLFFDQQLLYDPDKVGGTWHYPCPPPEPEPHLKPVED